MWESVNKAVHANILDSHLDRLKSPRRFLIASSQFYFNAHAFNEEDHADGMSFHHAHWTDGLIWHYRPLDEASAELGALRASDIKVQSLITTSTRLTNGMKRSHDNYQSPFLPCR